MLHSRTMYPSTNQNTPVRICTKTVMDTISNPEITFNAEGVSNYYITYQNHARKILIGGDEGQQKLDEVFAKIREDGKNKKYDCITGASGGVDSSYLILLCKKYGLRPLIVHLDNGWNSEIANQNINNIIDKTGFDLHTHVIDWGEFRDLQLSFLKSSVIDLELTSDHAIFSVIYELSRRHGIKYLLSGFNFATEGILPKAWRWSKFDWLNIKAIHKQYGTEKLKTFPHTGFWKKIFLDKVNKIQTIQPLNYIDFNEAKAKELISDEFGWRDYGGKHFESIITRFYQGYILPRKFGVDKRKAHLSTLIASGQTTRSQALQELQQPIYDAKTLEADREYVLKKFELSHFEFETLMNEAPRAHTEYPSYVTLHYKYHEQIMKFFSPLTRFAKKLIKSS